MKRYIAALLLGTCALFSACKKDATPQPSANVADAFIRTDDPSNPVAHQVFLIYQQTGIPILYNDTVRKSPLYVLNIGYHISAIDSLITARYSYNDDDILAGVSFIKDQIIPTLGKGLRPYSILLADSLFTYQYSYYGKTMVPLNAYVGMQALIIGNISRIKDLSADSLKIYKKDVLKNMLLPVLNAKDTALKNFYAVSAAFYNKSAYGTTYTDYSVPFQAKENYGLLSDGTESSYYYYITSNSDDLNRYLEVMLLLSTDEFTAKYGSYPLVMNKYNLMKKAFVSIGFIFPE